MINEFIIVLQAIGPLVFGAVLFDLPFAFAADFETRGARIQSDAVPEYCGQGGLPPAGGAETGYRPVESGQLQQTTAQASRLPQGKSEQVLQCPALEIDVCPAPGYLCPVALNSAAGFGDPELVGGHRRESGFFVSVHGYASMGRAVWEVREHLPVPTTGSPTRTVPPHPFGDGEAEISIR